jgi:hypothetical protein
VSIKSTFMRKRLNKTSILYFVLAILVFFIYPVLSNVLTKQFISLPDNFEYKANVVSYDNFYDIEKEQFSGKQQSKTFFSYNTIEQIDGIHIIQNIFDVRTPDNDPIFSVERLYGIDPVTKKHVFGYGDKDREGYLFAPNNLKEGDIFEYWHVNYDVPITMEYVESEVVDDLKVLRYESEFKTDQTNNLTYLDGVPEKYGIGLDVKIITWVEPITGILINYKDKSDAYYYDIETKEKLFPWNSFSNSFDSISVTNKIDQASSQKEIIKNIDIILKVSIVLFGTILVILGIYSMNHKIKIELIFSAITFYVSILVMMGWVWNMDFIKSILENAATMKFITASCFFLSSLLVGTMTLSISNIKDRATSFSKKIVMLFSSFLILLMISLSAVNMLLDKYLLFNSIDLSNGLGRGNLLFEILYASPSIGTMLAFVLIAIIGLLNIGIIGSYIKTARVLTIFVIILSLISITGYLTGNPKLSFAFNEVVNGMAIHTSVLFLLLGLSILKILRHKIKHEN